MDSSQVPEEWRDAGTVVKEIIARDSVRYNFKNHIIARLDPANFYPVNNKQDLIWFLCLDREEPALSCTVGIKVNEDFSSAKYVYRNSLGGFKNFLDCLPVAIHELLRHEAEGTPCSPNVYVLAPAEGLRIYSFPGKQNGKRTTVGTTGSHKALINLNSPPVDTWEEKEKKVCLGQLGVLTSHNGSIVNACQRKMPIFEKNAPVLYLTTSELIRLCEDVGPRIMQEIYDEISTHTHPSGRIRLRCPVCSFKNGKYLAFDRGVEEVFAPFTCDWSTPDYTRRRKNPNTANTNTNEENRAIVSRLLTSVPENSWLRKGPRVSDAVPSPDGVLPGTSIPQILPPSCLPAPAAAAAQSTNSSSGPSNLSGDPILVDWKTPALQRSPKRKGLANPSAYQNFKCIKVSPIKSPDSIAHYASSQQTPAVRIIPTSRLNTPKRREEEEEEDEEIRFINDGEDFESPEGQEFCIPSSQLPISKSELKPMVKSSGPPPPPPPSKTPESLPLLSASDVEGMLNGEMSTQDSISDVKPKDPRKRHRILIEDDDDDADDEEDKENTGNRFAASTQKSLGVRSSIHRPKRLSMGPSLRTSSSTIDSLTDDEELPLICFSQKE